MRYEIGFWIISLAFSLFVVFAFNPYWDFKEKMKTVFGYMMFMTLLIVGVYLMTGGL